MGSLMSRDLKQDDLATSNALKVRKCTFNVHFLTFNGAFNITIIKFKDIY